MNNDSLQTPYANLNPTLILNAVESLGLQCSGSLLALNSYENRVYQVGIEDQSPVIAKFYRPHRWTDAAIKEEHQFAITLRDRDIPVIAPIQNANGETLFHFDDYRFAIFQRQGGRALELDNLDHLELMGRFLGRLHGVGAIQPFTQRVTINADTFGYQPYQYLLDSNFIPEEVRHNYSRIVSIVLERVKQCFAAVGNVPLLRLHGDCHAGNVLWTDAGPHIVDLDDCMMGPAIQDIWMLLSGNKEQVKSQLDRILSGYTEFYDFNYRELYLIEALRSLRMIHYTAWLAKRWNDPAFPPNFPWFNTARYWQSQLEHLNEQAILLESTLDEMNSSPEED